MAQNYDDIPGAKWCVFPDLQPDEELLMVIRRHWFVFIILALFSLVFILITVGLLIVLFLTDATALFIYLLLIVSWFFWAEFLYIKWLDYELDFFLVTDKRIIGFEQLGFLNRKTVQASIDQIQEVFAINKGVFANIFHYGELRVQTASESTELVLPMIPEALETSRQIHNFIDKHRHTIRRVDAAWPTPAERIDSLLRRDS